MADFYDRNLAAQQQVTSDAVKQLEAYTASHAMSRDDFVKKYGATFVADDKGGNAASEVAGMDTGAYYDRYLDPSAPKTEVVHTLRGGDETRVIAPPSGGGRYSGMRDAYDNVNPHPESINKNGLDQVWTDIVRPVATIAAAAYGGWAAMGGGAATGVAAAATPASGLAGWVGMDAGAAATAVNAGALNTGISLAQGKNIGDSLKSGIAAGALSGVGGWASSGIKDATVELGSTISNGLANVGSKTLTGAIGAGLTGQDIGQGATNGFIAGGLTAAGNIAGNEAKGILADAAGPTVGNIAGGIVNTAISGNLSPMISAATNSIPEFATLTNDQKSAVNAALTQAVKGKQLTQQQIINLAIEATAKVKA